MTQVPTVVERTEQPYAAVRAEVTMQTILAIATRHDEVFHWLDAQGVAAAGPPFLRYNRIDMATTLEIEAGVPVAAPVRPAGDIVAGVLPAGRYATVTHVGHPDGLMGATAELLRWAEEQGLGWDVSNSERGEHWGCRLEVYHDDPDVQPDLTKWETDLVFRLAD